MLVTSHFKEVSSAQHDNLSRVSLHHESKGIQFITSDASYFANNITNLLDWQGFHMQTNQYIAFPPFLNTSVF